MDMLKENKIGNVRWGITTLLIFDYIVLYMGRVAMSTAGPALMKEYGWNATEFGWISTAFFIGYAVTMIPSGALADRFGGGLVLIIGTLWYCVFTFLTPFGTTLGLMMLLRILVGVGQGVFVPSNSSIVSRWFPKKESGKAMGFLLMGIPIGMALTMLMASWILGAFGWKGLFYTFACLGPIWCLLWLKWGKNRPDQHPKLGKAEMEYIQSDQDSESGTSNLSSLSKGDIFSTASVWACAFSYFCSNYLFFLFMTWLPTYFAMGRGIDIKSSLIYSMLPNLVAIVTYPLGGTVADAWTKKWGANIGRKIGPVVGLILAGVFLLIGTKAGDIWTAVILISLSNGLLCFTMGSYFSIPMDFSKKDTGTIAGFNGFIGTFAGIIAPVLSGWVIDLSGHYSSALYLGAFIALLGAIIIAFARIKPIVAKHVKTIKDD